MKRLLGAIALAAACFAPAQAADYKLGTITISDPWVRATPGKAKNGAGYLEIHNMGEPDRLLSASSNVSKRTELHTHIADNGIMRMRKIEGGIELPHGGTAVLKPHGNHVMLMGLDKPLKEGEMVHLTFTFEKAGEISIDVPVMPVGHMGSPMHKNKMDHGHGMKKDMKGHGHGSGMKKDMKAE